MDADNAGTDGTSFVTSDNGTAAPLQAEIQTAHAALKVHMLVAILHSHGNDMF